MQWAGITHRSQVDLRTISQRIQQSNKFEPNLEENSQTTRIHQDQSLRNYVHLLLQKKRVHARVQFGALMEDLRFRRRMVLFLPPTLASEVPNWAIIEEDNNFEANPWKHGKHHRIVDFKLLQGSLDL